jgi:hypothetical protein
MDDSPQFTDNDFTEALPAPIPAPEHEGDIEIVNLTATADDLPLELTDIVTPLGVMVDLETFGTGNDAVIVSIGAVKFSETEILDKFHVGVDPQSATAFGLKMDAATIMQRSAARAALLSLERVDLPSALLGFALWLGADSLPLWGNGATFDNIILRSAYAHCGLDYPVKFYHDRCYRTIKNLAPDIALERVGTLHDALDDAESQARHLMAIAKYLGVVL